jgi:hypothetical protein
MSLFRKKPVVIEAVRCKDLHYMMGEDWYALPKWFIDAYEGKNESGVKTIIGLNHPSRIEIVTLEGVMTADIGDWIIRGVNGELYPCKPDIFEKIYDPA